MSSFPSPFEPGNGLPADPASRIGDIKSLRDLSRRYMEDNYWGEFEEVWRAVSCRTKPIMLTQGGKQVEDENRTNVCMPELAVAVKRKTARLTANPPNMKYMIPGDDSSMLAERLTARQYYEFDRSGEIVEFRRMVQQAETFGFSYSKTYHDTVTVQRQMRYLRAKLRDRRRLMETQGAPADAIDEAIAQHGPEVSETEVSAAIEEQGPEIRSSIPFKLYEGPVTKCRFIGDIAIEPKALTLNASGWVFENYTETDLWLQSKVKQTYPDPETGLEVPVFNPKAVQELWDQDIKLTDDKRESLKRRLRAAVQQSDPRLETRLLPNKRFEIDEYHAPDAYGRIWIEYIGNDSIYLGRHPMAFDLGGKWVYTEFVPWMNLIGAIGDSSPRLLRFLHRMHNAAVGSRQDLISNLLRRTYTADSEEDIPEAVIRRDFGNILVLNGANTFRALEEADVPASAWETESQIKSEMMQAEPAIGGIESPGGTYTPMAGKTATTSILANKSNDALIQLELDSLNITVKEIGEKKLEIHRQLSDGLIPVPGRFMSKEHAAKAQELRDQNLETDATYKEQFEALSSRFDKTSLITIDPYEIQDPGIEVEPEAGSTLAVDDELKAQGVMNFYELASQDPVTFNKRYAAEQLCMTIRGIDKTKALNPEAPPAPPAPKVSFNISLALDKAASVPADILNPLLQEAGLQPSQDVVKMQELQALGHLSKAADAAANLGAPAKPEPSPETPAAVKAELTKVNGKG